MRIAYYTHPHYLEPALHFAREMATRADIHFFLEVSPGSWQRSIFDATPEPLPAGLSPAAPFFERHFPAGLKDYWREFATFSIVSQPQRRSIDPRNLPISHQVAGEIRRLQADVLHVDDPDMSLRMGFVMPELARLPTVANIHEPLPRPGEYNRRKALSRWLFYRHIDRFILHNHSQVAAFKHLHARARERTSVIRLGAYDIVQEWNECPLAEDRHNVLFFGRIEPYKGLQVLFDAVRLVAEKVPEVRITIAGAGSGADTASLGSVAPQGTIELINRYVPTSELSRLFQRAAIVVCPYVASSQSGVVLTAYGFDKPVVTTDVGGLPEYIKDGHNGLLVPSNDPHQLADALIRCLTDDDLQASLRKGVLESKQKDLSWSRAADEALAVYEQVKKPA
jgi:glycosyltransferase involved in cell wall biosynthesis